MAQLHVVSTESVASESTSVPTMISTINQVKWLDYAKNMMDHQRHIYADSSLSDVTIVAGPVHCKAHQIVLSASSEFFCKVLAESNATTVILIPDLNPDLLEPLMTFIYTGQTSVRPTALSDFLAACDFLKIKGFLNYACMVNGIKLQKQHTTNQPHQPPQQQPAQQFQHEGDAQQASDIGSVKFYTSKPATTAAHVSISSSLASTNEPNSSFVHIDDDHAFELEAFIQNEPVLADMESAACNTRDPIGTVQLEAFEEYLDEDDDTNNEEAEDGVHEQLEDCSFDNIASDNASDKPKSDQPDEVSWLVDQHDLAAVEPSESPIITSTEHSTPPARQRSRRSANAANATNTGAEDQPLESCASNDALAYKSSTSKSYSDETLADAMAELNAGGSVVDVAAKYEIPRSTIYARVRCGRDRIYRQYQQSKLDEAVRSVTETGISLKEASSRYDVSKTVLWRALKKSNVYKPGERIQLTRADALKAIQRGDTLMSISKAYNVPLATLHRDKVRLFRDGKLPEHCKLRKRDAGIAYRKRLDAAVASCRNGMPQKIASEKHGVPKTTIWRHLQRIRLLEAKGDQPANDAIEDDENEKERSADSCPDGEDDDYAIGEDDDEPISNEDEHYELLGDDFVYKDDEEMASPTTHDHLTGGSLSSSVHYVIVGETTASTTPSNKESSEFD